MSNRSYVYFRYGFERRQILKCADCGDAEAEYFNIKRKAILTQTIGEAYRSIVEVIQKAYPKSVNYYDAVRIAYKNDKHQDLKDYLGSGLKERNQ